MGIGATLVPTGKSTSICVFSTSTSSTTRILALALAQVLVLVLVVDLDLCFLVTHEACRQVEPVDIDAVGVHRRCPAEKASELNITK